MATVTAFRARPRYQDADDRDGYPDIALAGNPAAVDADFLTAVDALVATSNDTGTGAKMTMGGIVSVQLVIEITPASVPNPAVGDIRDVWELTFPTTNRKLSIPGRSTAGVLTGTASEGAFADKTQTAVTDWFDAMFGSPPGGIGAVDPLNSSTPTLGALVIRADTTRRKRR